MVASTDILEGETLTNENIWVKRPGNGDFDAEDFYDLIGKKLLKYSIRNQLKKKIYFNCRLKISS